MGHKSIFSFSGPAKSWCGDNTLCFRPRLCFLGSPPAQNTGDGEPGVYLLSQSALCTRRLSAILGRFTCWGLHPHCPEAGRGILGVQVISLPHRVRGCSGRHPLKGAEALKATTDTRYRKWEAFIILGSETSGSFESYLVLWTVSCKPVCMFEFSHERS